MVVKPRITAKVSSGKRKKKSKKKRKRKRKEKGKERKIEQNLQNDDGRIPEKMAE